MLKKKLGISSFLYFAPFVALAQTQTGLIGFLGKFGEILNTVIPLIIGLAFVFFLWGVFVHLNKENIKIALPLS